MIARLAAASLLALAAATPALAAEKGQPPITAQTASSGGPLTPEQKAVRFDTADLSFEVFPDREAIAGVATLDFTAKAPVRSEEHTSELQSLMRISYAVFCLKNKNTKTNKRATNNK